MGKKPREIGLFVYNVIDIATSAYYGGLIAYVIDYADQHGYSAPHSHPPEQIGYLLKGSFDVTIGDEQTVLKEGDSYYAQPGVVHGVVALEDGALLDVFTPQRDKIYQIA